MRHYKKKTGHPLAIIDWPRVDQYLQAQCTGSAIAGILGIHPDTLYRACERDKKMTFAAYSQSKRAEGIELLKAAQFSSAMGGNPTMQIWLGKQLLQQRDKADISDDRIPPSISITVTSSENATKLKEFLDGESH